ncbi:uncharacterized protein LOC122564766 isoform X2 [Chiloscyllium plagiosum]|uniref:uncharacterized protein LOC122564766 isoform X2 n=1 Tax=Chiloscyllium plagiosum TaxID=36176 RepID=UPI001CB7F784|nr:uncharacterized protein LOC122564766 isoform X2 [Chiloscyllium plagiosum]
MRALDSTAQLQGCPDRPSQSQPYGLRSRTSGRVDAVRECVFWCWEGGRLSCACAQLRAPDNNGLTVGHVQCRLEPGAAMKWSWPFRLLLMLWLTAPSGQRVVPAQASPSLAESTRPEGDTPSLTFELDEEDEATTPGSSTSGAHSSGAAAPLKIEIDMEELTENGTGRSPADATEPAWHPYLIKISSGTGTAAATTTGGPELAVLPPGSLMEETIVMQLPEASPVATSTTVTPPLLIIEELTPSSPPEPGSVLLPDSPTESVLVLDEKELKAKSKKQALAQLQGSAPHRQQKGGPPPSRQKLKSPNGKTAGEDETSPPQVFFLIKEVEHDAPALQQELPMAIQVIGSNASVPGISTKEAAIVTRVPDTSVKDVNAVASSTDSIVTEVPGSADVEDIGTDSSTVVVSGMDPDNITSSPDVIATTVTGVEDISTSSNAMVINDMDTDTVTKTPDILLTKVPSTLVEDIGTNSTLVINRTDSDTIPKISDTDVQEIINSTDVPMISITDTESITKAPVVSIQEDVTSTNAPVIVTGTDTNSKTPSSNAQEVITSTNAPVFIPVTDTNSKAQSTSVQEVVTGTDAPVISLAGTDTNSKTLGTRALDFVTNTSAPVIRVTETNAIAEVPTVSVQKINTGTIVPVISISEMESTTKTPAIILTTQGTTDVEEMDSEVENTFLDMSDKGMSVTSIVDKIIVPEPHFKELYFDQLVDHFSFTSHQKLYRQRYLLCDQFWSKKFGPIFLYTGNEGDIWDFANSSRFIIELASEQQALVIFAEHRYYGKSLPFGKKSYERSNMEFLTVEQALADYVVLITKLKSDLDAKSCAVIAFGGSYGGMLSAYMRIKYPNVVDGALASSAPVVSTANLGDSRQFFHDVTKDFERNSPECVLTIRKGFQELEFLAQQQAWSKITNKLSLCKSVKSKKDVDHLYGWARNAFTYLAMFNYPYKTEVGLHFPPNPVDVACRYILKKSDHIEGLLDILGMFYNSTGTKKCFDIYSEYIHCSDPTGCGLGSSSQAWDFQACTEINLLYESNNDTDMFPVIPFTEAMRRNYCHSKWGVYPNSQWLKIQYWGDDYKAASNIIFSNGDLDPWANGGILKTMNPSVITFVIEGAAHHLDLRASNVADPPSVTVVRKMESSIIRKWVKSSQLRYV